MILGRQINKDGSIVEQLTMSQDEVDHYVSRLTAFLSQLMANLSAAQQPPQANLQPANVGAADMQTTSVPEPSAVGQPPQLNAGNLQAVTQQQQALRQQQQAVNRRNQQKAPAAPTEAAPPFQIGPDGVPNYAAAGLTPEKLKLPPKKKQKTAQATSAGSTPAQAVPAPTAPSQVPKPTSPTVKRQQVQDVAKAAADVKPFRCAVPECESKGFDSQFELDKHKNDVHVKIDDPVQFATDSMLEAFELNVVSFFDEGVEGETQETEAATAQSMVAQPAPTKAGDKPEDKKDGAAAGIKQTTPIGLRHQEPIADRWTLPSAGPEIYHTHADLHGTRGPEGRARQEAPQSQRAIIRQSDRRRRSCGRALALDRIRRARGDAQPFVRRHGRRPLQRAVRNVTPGIGVRQHALDGGDAVAQGTGGVGHRRGDRTEAPRAFAELLQRCRRRRRQGHPFRRPLLPVGRPELPVRRPELPVGRPRFPFRRSRAR